MNDFMTLAKKEADEINNISYTENGAKGYRSTGKALLDLNFSVSSLRSVPNFEVVTRFMETYHEDRELALKWLFFARDIRQGMGEKRLWKLCMNFLARNFPDHIRHLITPEIMGEYGSWKDILVFFGTPLQEDALKCIQEQLRRDRINQMEGKPISLLAKWLPSINTTSADSRKIAAVISNHLHLKKRDYRKMLADMRRYIKVVEQKMSAGEWNRIEYEHVPSVANMKYAKSFMRHDEDRRREYLAALSKGEVKINSKDLFPYQITCKMHEFYANVFRGLAYSDGIRDRDLAKRGIYIKHDFELTSNYKVEWENYNMDMIEGMWKNLPNLIPEDASVLVVRDGSGSMGCNGLPGTNVSAFDVANSLTMYFAERLPKPWRNKFITFSARPEMITLPDTLKNYDGKEFTASTFDKFRCMLYNDDMTNTDIEAVFDLVLSTAVNNNLKQEELPNSILIISDMEFDDATTESPNKTLFSYIEQKFTDKGYKLPRLVFWNVCSRTETIPVKENELGVTLVSGFSIQIMNMVMSNKTDPYEVLLETLNSERYKPITVLNNKE